MEQILQAIEKSGYSRPITSLVLIFLLWAIRSTLTRNIRKTGWRTEDKRKWYVLIRNWSTSVLIIGLVVIWATELQTFALSVVALTGALIISGKELLLCIHGGLLRSFNNLFKIGDRIEIDNIRGDVIDTNLFITKVLEIGPQNFTHQFTGRSIIIPNSLFLTKELINESFLHKYVLHVFKLSFPRTVDWEHAEACMREAAHNECKNFIENAQKSMDSLAIREGLEVPKAEPRITYKFTNPNELEMIVRVPSPASRKGNIEQQILKSFMKSFLGKNQEES
ncbi:unnamed protein product [Chrysoparadoxa australica]